MKTLAFIPARGGSKGIPKKNLRQVGGSSLIARAVRTCFDCEYIDNVIVSTDDSEIGCEAMDAGAGVHWRPAGLCGDDVGTEIVVADYLTDRRLGDIKAVIVFQCTSPMITASDLDQLVERFAACRQADAGLLAIESNAHLVELDDEGFMIPVAWDWNDPKPRQLVAKRYELAGIWVGRPATIAETRRLYQLRTLVVPVDRPKLDIDSLADLALADAAMRGGFDP